MPADEQAAEDQRMNWVSLVRAIGVIAGVVLLVLGAAWLVVGLADPPTQNFGTFILLAGLVLAPGALMVAPWSRIRPPALWYSLFIMLVLVVPPGALLILAVNTWSALHGAGGAGFALVGFLLVVWAIQLPAIWALRATGNESGI
jgi:hypothetical protein